MYTAEQRLLMTLLVVFGVAAGLLAALGVYGLFSWSVALRTRELAIRLTLGAKPLSVGVRVIRQSVSLIAVGLIMGLAIVWLAETALRRVLFDMSPARPGVTRRRLRVARRRRARCLRVAGAARATRRSGGRIARRIVATEITKAV
jgi:ABC-type lipoprotein release transport system permease subunit